MVQCNKLLRSEENEGREVFDTFHERRDENVNTHQKASDMPHGSQPPPTLRCMMNFRHLDDAWHFLLEN